LIEVALEYNFGTSTLSVLNTANRESFTTLITMNATIANRKIQVMGINLRN